MRTAGTVKGTTMIAVHDGARPLVKTEQIAQVIQDASVFGGATLGVPVKDTIKVVNDRLIVDTPYRPHLYITQTPQVFKRQLYFEAVTFAEEHALDFTDDCQLIEAINCKVYMTEGTIPTSRSPRRRTSPLQRFCWHGRRRKHKWRDYRFGSGTAMTCTALWKTES